MGKPSSTSKSLRDNRNLKKASVHREPAPATPLCNTPSLFANSLRSPSVPESQKKAKVKLAARTASLSRSSGDDRVQQSEKQNETPERVVSEPCPPPPPPRSELLADITD